MPGYLKIQSKTTYSSLVCDFIVHTFRTDQIFGICLRLLAKLHRPPNSIQSVIFFYRYPDLHSYFVFSLCAILSILSCTKKTETNDGIQRIVLEESIDYTEKEVIDSVRYLQLETNDDSLISYVSQLFCTDREIIIFDIYTQAVYVFDYGGKFLRKLHKQGQGPGEYATILSISIDETTNEILIVDSGSRVLCYDLSSFDYLREIQMEAIAVQKEKANSLIAYNASSITKDGQPYNYYLTRWEDGAISKGFIPIEFSSGYLMAPNYRFYT